MAGGRGGSKCNGVNAELDEEGRGTVRWGTEESYEIDRLRNEISVVKFIAPSPYSREKGLHQEVERQTNSHGKEKLE